MQRPIQSQDLHPQIGQALGYSSTVYLDLGTCLYGRLSLDRQPVQLVALVTPHFDLNGNLCQSVSDERVLAHGLAINIGLLTVLN